MNKLFKKEKNIKQNVIFGLVPESHEILNRATLVQNDVVFQRGRSMVEMLGVLAVMGVLSVGGVAMYTSAMNKHRANELLNEASKRAVVVVPQIAMGNTPSIGEFTNPSDHNFELKGPDGTSDWKNTDKQFAITISGVSEAVCQQMKNAKSGVIKDFKPDPCADNATVILTYNNDMSTEDLPSNTGSTTVCSGHGYKDSNDDCVCDPGYSGTDCATAACTTGTYCGNNSGTAICCGTDEVCTTSGDVAGTCVKNSSGCTTNASCNDSTKYCKLTGTWQNSCSVTGGTCEPLDAGRETTYTDPNDTTKTKTFLVSSGNMSWWAADNWCKAHGRKLVSYSTVNSLFDCDKDSKECTCSKFTTDSYWSNGALPDYYWTAESYDSCYAWYVNVNDAESFGNTNRYYSNHSALCE